MSKSSRYQSISINSQQNDEESYWLDEFKKRLERTAVQSRESESLYDQINSIMNGKSKSKYSSVEDAVKEMKERSGLTKYLSTKQACSTCGCQDDNQVIDKTIPIEESSVQVVLPSVIKKYPNIKKTIQNVIESSRGNSTLPAIIERVKSIHKSDVSDDKDWDENNLLKYISRANLEEKSKYFNNQNESTLGVHEPSFTDEVDEENSNAFHSLEPAK